MKRRLAVLGRILLDPAVSGLALCAFGFRVLVGDDNAVIGVILRS